MWIIFGIPIRNDVQYNYLDTRYSMNYRVRVMAQLERMKELCKERKSLYEKQNDLKGQKQKIEKSLRR